MSQTPEGWYADPERPATLRWWDGQAWTEHRSPQPVAQPSPQYAPLQSPIGYDPYAGQGMAQPPRRGRRGMIALFVVLTVLAFVVFSGWAIVSAVRGALDIESVTATPSDPLPSASPDIESFNMSDRPGYDELVTYVEDMYAKYDAAYQDGTIYEYVPDSDEGRAYAWTFINIILDYKVSFLFSGSSTSAEELDDMIAGIRNKTEEYERRFLAGEDLERSVRTVDSDGNVFEYDGTTPQGNPEEFARNFQAYVDDDGTYVAASEELAAEFGMYLTFDYESILDHCTMSSPTEVVGAAFCGVTPELIYVNTEYQNYPAMLSQPDFVDMIRHEIAHRQIFEACGTIQPPVTGNIHEGVTNSYAVSYLGAVPENLGKIDDSYTMTDQTYDMADSIASGQCGY